MPPQEASLDPASRSIVARLRVISLVIWIMGTAVGAVCGLVFVLPFFAAMHETPATFWYKAALVIVVVCSGVVGCLIGYFAKIFIDWARQVLVLLGHIAR